MTRLAALVAVLVALALGLTGSLGPGPRQDATVLAGAEDAAGAGEAEEAGAGNPDEPRSGKALGPTDASAQSPGEQALEGLVDDAPQGRDDPEVTGQTSPEDAEAVRDAADAAEALAGELAQPRETTLLQLNLCLSGLAGCYSARGYAAKLREAVTVIRSTAADVVVVNEACSGDAEAIARATGMSVTFSTVTYGSRALPCRDPRGRGSFGNAVLSEQPVGVDDVAFRAQSYAERRRAICAEVDSVTVCGTHLSNDKGDGRGRAARGRQCGEVADLTARAARSQPVVVAGDFNRVAPCAPAGFAVFTDAGATQKRGIQHAYVDPRLGPATSSTIAMRSTDHDALVVRFTRASVLDSGGVPADSTP